jgi:hypothetical protein
MKNKINFIIDMKMKYNINKYPLNFKIYPLNYLNKVK